VKVDPRIIELLLFSLEMHERTDGAVNVAMGAVLSIWHEYRTKGVSVPDFEVLNAASEHCDISKLIIDKDASTVYLADPEMSLDVGAVAKGFAIDCAVKRLKDRGASSYAVDVGGNLYAIGKKPSGEPLKTGIQNPLGGDYSAVIEIADGSVATSGDYQRYYTVNGVRYHHIIHPDTLYPADIHRSVSVYSSSAALSDALSTALFNMNEEHGKALVEKEFPNVRALVYVGDDGIGRTVRFGS
jgi:thiamine biosynthesis lipoprotein